LLGNGGGTEYNLRIKSSLNLGCFFAMQPEKVLII